MNILVLGGGFLNKGNEAMLRVVQRELVQRIDGANIFALLNPHEEFVIAYAAGIIPTSLQNPKTSRFIGTTLAGYLTELSYLIQTGSISLLARSIYEFKKVSGEILPNIIDRAIEGMDAVLDIHGYAFGDPWPLESMKAAEAWADFCIRRGKPYCFLPQSWGPFERDGYARQAAALIRKATLLYTRENLSQRYIANALKIGQDHILKAPDTVFRFQNGNKMLGKAVLDSIGVSISDKPLIGITPNLRVYERMPGVGTGNEYILLLSRICDHCIEKHNVNIVLIPNEINPRGYIRRDDRFLCNLVSSMTRNREGCFAFREYYSAEQIHSVVACLDLLVGSRFHTLVFALSTGTPVVALGWAHKYDGLLQEFRIKDYFCHCSNFDDKRIFDLVDTAWEARTSTSRLIKSALPGIYFEVDSVFDKVAQVLKSSL